MSPRVVGRFGVTLLLLAAAGALLAAAIDVGWLLAVALVAFVGGLFTIGSLFTPERSSFRAGTRIWQNEGPPGGGGSGGL